jgi:hypothetical protein
MIVKSDFLILELNQPKEAERNEENISTSSPVFQTENEFECIDNELTELSSTDESTSLTTTEDDEQQTEEEDSNSSEKDVFDDVFYSSIADSRPKFSDQTPPPVAPRHSRQNSGCSTQSSVRYAS